MLHLDGQLETQHLAKKRSKCQNWKNPKILRFDDDDYYFPIYNQPD